MKEIKYSTELADVIKNYLNENDWRYSFDEKTGIINFSMGIYGKLNKLDFYILIHEKCIVVHAVSAIGADIEDETMMTQMSEYINRVNYGTRNGCFEFDFEDGEIRYKSYIDCDDIIPSYNVLKNSISCSATMFEYYAPGMLAIIFLGYSASDAAEVCENSVVDRIKEIFVNSDEDNDDTANEDDTEEMVDRLFKRFGYEPNMGEDSKEENVGESINILIDPFKSKKEEGEE